MGRLGRNPHRARARLFLLLVLLVGLLGVAFGEPILAIPYVGGVVVVVGWCAWLCLAVYVLQRSGNRRRGKPYQDMVVRDPERFPVRRSPGARYRHRATGGALCSLRQRGRSSLALLARCPRRGRTHPVIQHPRRRAHHCATRDQAAHHGPRIQPRHRAHRGVRQSPHGAGQTRAQRHPCTATRCGRCTQCCHPRPATLGSHSGLTPGALMHAKHVRPRYFDLILTAAPTRHRSSRHFRSNRWLALGPGS